MRSSAGRSTPPLLRLSSPGIKRHYWSDGRAPQFGAFGLFTQHLAHDGRAMAARTGRTQAESKSEGSVIGKSGAWECGTLETATDRAQPSLKFSCGNLFSAVWAAANQDLDNVCHPEPQQGRVAEE